MRRLDAESSLCRVKQRRPGTLARVHTVRLVLTAGGSGRVLGREPFPLAPMPEVDGIPSPEIATIRVGPWLGPFGPYSCETQSARPPESAVWADVLATPPKGSENVRVAAAAHRGALGADGVTIAVLACGIDAPYPAAHAELRVPVPGPTSATNLAECTWPT